MWVAVGISELGTVKALGPYDTQEAADHATDALHIPGVTWTATPLLTATPTDG